MPSHPQPQHGAWPWSLAAGSRVGTGAGVPWPLHMSEAVNEVDADGSKRGGVLVVVNIFWWGVLKKWCINELSSFEFPVTFFV